MIMLIYIIDYQNNIIINNLEINIIFKEKLLGEHIYRKIKIILNNCKKIIYGMLINLRMQNHIKKLQIQQVV